MPVCCILSVIQNCTLKEFLPSWEWVASYNLSHHFLKLHPLPNRIISGPSWNCITVFSLFGAGLPLDILWNTLQLLEIKNPLCKVHNRLWMMCKSTSFHLHNVFFGPILSLVGSLSQIIHSICHTHISNACKIALTCKCSVNTHVLACTQAVLWDALPMDLCDCHLESSVVCMSP